MKLTLIGWESLGLRCPDMTIDLTQNGKVPRVSLVQMPNGTGKTTTLDLIMTALTGKAREWPSIQVRRYRRAGETNDQGKFVLKLLVENDPLTFELLFDFIEDKVVYRTTSKSKGGVRDGWEPPAEVRRFLNDRFVRLFIFNGELAEDLLDSAQTKASEAIDTLCQLEHLDKIVYEARADWQNATRNQGAKTPSGLASYKTREERFSTRLEKVQALQNGLRSELEKVTQKIGDLQGQLNSQLQYDHSTEARKDELIEEIRAHEDRLLEKTRYIFQLIRQPQFLSSYFSGGLVTLKDQFDRVRLPESTSRQFFVELADEQTCVCGRQITELERQSILGQADRYLASEQYSFINHLKQNIKQFVVDEPAVTEMSVVLSTTELRSLRRELSDLRTEMDEIRNDSIASAADSTKVLAEEVNVQLAKQDEIVLGLSKIDEFPEANVDENSLSIRGLQRELKKVRELIAQITGTVELKSKIDLIISVADKAKEIARQRLRDAIRNDCNSRLSKVLSGDPICIDKIQQSLSLHNQDGASVGQTLAVGYTFLTTLLNRGVHKFPLVVDSPAGPLDDLVRGQVGRLIPGLCDQFVGFTISTEREHFLPALEDAVGDSIVYLTAFRASSGMKQMIDEVPSHAQRTRDGVVVSGREYFMNFVIPQEQE